MSRLDPRPRNNRPWPWHWLILPVLLSVIGLALPSAIRAQASPRRALSAEPVWTYPDEGTWFTTTITPSCDVSDEDGLETSSAQYRYTTNGGATWTSWATDSNLQVSSSIATSARMTLTLPALPDSATQNQVQLQIADQGTQTNTSPTYTVLVDNSAPQAPISLIATPATWTRVDSFTLSWGNPSDTSGIAGAYYKVGDMPPSSAADWTGYVAGEELVTIDDLSMTSSGAHNVYVWLADTAGNSDHTRYATTTCYLDVTPPSPVTNLVAIPDGWSNEDSFDLTWTNPVEMSGIAGAYYKVGDTPPPIRPTGRAMPPATTSARLTISPSLSLANIACTFGLWMM